MFILIVGFLVNQNIILNNKLRNINSDFSNLKNNNEYLNLLFMEKIDAERPWFTNLTKELVSNKIILSKITSVMEDLEVNYVAMVYMGEYCDPPIVYRFNTLNNKIEKATLDLKGRECLATGGYFSSNYQGDTSKITSTGGDAGCEVKMYFDYDIQKNIGSLSSESSFCEGDTESTRINY